MNVYILVVSLLSCFASANPLAHDSPLYSKRAASAVGDAVNTTSGEVQGHASELRPEVSEYLGIPYAEPPTGDLRFAAPVAAARASNVTSADSFSPDCPCNRIPTDKASIGGPAGEKILIALAQTGDQLDENCLTVNVWTKPQSGESKKAVLFWIYGGGFSTGNTANPIYDGSVLADEQDVVVVSVNYRLNIFGFSGAPGQPTNVGLLDQRLALEWARDNVEAFGGDPARITVFGQSAGGASVDYIAYGWKDDPIAHALIPQSGVAGGVVTGGASLESVQANWYNVSETLGCGGEEAGEATVTCMRTKSMDQILGAMLPLQATAIMSGFEPIADEIIVPSDIAARGAAGDFAKLPYLTGNTDQEANFFLVVLVAYSNLSTETINAIPVELAQPILDLITLIGFTCPAAQAAGYRQQYGIPTWRYRFYGGNYTNIYINKVGAAYHTAELPIVFGTAAAVTDIPDTSVEAQMAAYMRSAWSTFAKDPTSGLSTELGWPTYNPLTISEVRLAYEQETNASFILNAETDALCGVVDTTEALLSTLSGLLSDLETLLFGNGSTTSNSTELLDVLSQPHNTTASMATFIQNLLSISSQS